MKFMKKPEIMAMVLIFISLAIWRVGQASFISLILGMYVLIIGSSLIVQYEDNNNKTVKNIKLQEKTGIKIRKLCFENALNLFVFLLLIVAIPLWLLVGVEHYLGNEIESWITIALYCPAGVLVIIIPLYIISLLNRYFWGKIFCVVSDEGISLENDFIPWNKIKNITYKIEHKKILKWKKTLVSRLYIFIEGNTHPEVIEDFPFYGFRMIKKTRPQIERHFNINQFLLIMFFFICLVTVVLFCIYNSYSIYL